LHKFYHSPQRDAQISACIFILQFSFYAFSFLKVIPGIFVLKSIRYVWCYNVLLWTFILQKDETLSKMPVSPYVSFQSYRVCLWDRDTQSHWDSWNTKWHW